MKKQRKEETDIEKFVKEESFLKDHVVSSGPERYHFLITTIT
jgi:hypothetical protein